MDRVLIFFDGSILMVDEKTLEEAKKGGGDSIKINGEGYKLSGIAKNLSLDGFYKQYPEKRPEQPREFPYEAQDVRPMTEEEYKRMHKGLSGGLKSFIDQQNAKGIKTPNAQAIYDSWKDKKISKDAVLHEMPGKGASRG